MMGGGGVLARVPWDFHARSDPLIIFLLIIRSLNQSGCKVSIRGSVLDRPISELFRHSKVLRNMMLYGSWQVDGEITHFIKM